MSPSSYQPLGLLKYPFLIFFWTPINHQARYVIAPCAVKTIMLACHAELTGLSSASTCHSVGVERNRVTIIFLRVLYAQNVRKGTLMDWIRQKRT